MKPLVAELNLNRRLGVEHEMAIALVGSGGGRDVRETVARILTANGVHATSREYSHAPVPEGYDVAIESDSSVQGHSLYQGVSYHSVELKTRILEGLPDWENIVPTCLSLCKYLRGNLNRTTGHHVHISFPEAQDPRRIRSLFNLIHHFQPLIYAIVSPSRLGNGYARRIPLDSSRLLHGCKTRESFRRNLSNWDRQCGLNLTHVFEPAPRIEFRYHQGTLDVEKARHWLRFLNRLVEHAITRHCQAARQQTEPTIEAFDNFLLTIGLRANTGIYKKVSPELRQTASYLRKRFKHFQAQISRNENELDDTEDV